MSHDWFMENRFKEIINKSGIKLEGIVLDLCSGNISIASIYDQKKVVCYEFYDKIIKELKNKKMRIVQANICNEFFPFKSNAFNYSFSGWLPFRPATCKKNILPKDIEDPEKFLYRITSEIIRVTKKQAIINSSQFIKYFPKQYSYRIQKQDTENALIVLNCKD